MARVKRDRPEKAAGSARTAGHVTAGPEDAYASLKTGPGRALVAVYAILALAATARASDQLIREYSTAPVAYILSAFSGVVYIVATICLARANRTAHRVAVVACSIELVGVIVVGILSLAVPSIFQQPSVWSLFGIGYGFVPLVLPVLGLLWLRRTERLARESSAR